jgi:predicted AAA+ superfamily ATPase
VEQRSIQRHMESRVEESLVDTPIVVIQGARQVGKSTLGTAVVANHGGLLVTLDDTATREAAANDPHGFVAQFSDGLLGIDEVQRVPELVLALKAAVDAGRRPGRFLLTGSADLLRLPTTQDSLAGRAESAELFGFSQGELIGVRESFIDELFAGRLFRRHTSQVTRHDYLLRACAGGYPEVLARESERRRGAWLDGYVDRIIQRDAADVSRLQRLNELPKLLRLLAARNATELNQSSLAVDADIPTRTLPPYLDLLETLYLIGRIPAWSSNLSKRVVERPKLVLFDTGLAARLINVSGSGAGPDANPNVAGQLIEGFVIAEILRHLGWAEESPRLHHYRERSGGEVDLVLETADGRIAALEIKASATVQARDIKWISNFRDQIGKRFVGGLVLHTGPRATALGDRLAAVPIDVLWAASR